EVSIIRNWDVRVLAVETNRLSRDSRIKRYPALQGAVVPPRAILGIPIGPQPSDQATGGPFRSGRLARPCNRRQYRLAALDGHLARRCCHAFLSLPERQPLVA